MNKYNIDDVNIDLNAYRTVYDNSPVAFALIHVLMKDNCYDDFEFVYANKGYERMSGFSVESLNGHTYSEVCGSKSEQWNSIYGKVAYQGGEHVSIEYGPEIDRYVNIVCHQVALGYCALTVLDVTEQVEAEHRTNMEFKKKYELEKQRIARDNSIMAYAVFNLSKYETIEIVRNEKLSAIDNKTSMEEFCNNVAGDIVKVNQKKHYCDIFNRQHLLNQYAKGTDEQYIDFQRKLADDKIIWVRARLFLMQEPNESEILLFYTCSDINIQKSMEIMTSSVVEEDYDMLGYVNLLQDTCIMWYGHNSSRKDAGAGLLTANEIYSRSLEWFVNNAVIPEEREHFRTKVFVHTIRKELAEHGRYVFQIHVMDDAGAVRTKEIRYTQYDSELELCMFTQTDVTELLEQREQQKSSEQERNVLNRIIQNVPAGLFVFKMDSDGRIEIAEANPAACELMGIDFNKTIGSGTKEVFELTHPEDRDIVKDVITKARVPGTVTPYEYRQYNKIRKEYCWLSAMAHSVLDENGDILIYISYFDISERKKAQKLKEDLKIAQMENQAKTEFMSNMSHDMRTPLNGILGLSYLMLEENSVDVLHEDVKQLIMSGKLLLSLINDTLDISKIESGRLVLNMQPIDSYAVFKSIITTVELSARNAGINLVYTAPKIPEGKWITVVSDSSRIEQIMINVISNAIKYSKEGQTVELIMDTLEVTKDMVTDRYRVVDHGIGMSEEFIPHIFEPYVQEGRMNTARSQGSGLGMAIVKQLVELLGGSIQVESKLNEGTTVTIIMHYPVYKGVVETEKKQPEIKVDISGMKVLLCEDHPINRQIAIQLLKKQGVIVDYAENGKEGLEIFEQSETGYYDVILMDIRMPVMDGITATKAIRSLSRADAATIPVIAMTANAFEEDKEQSQQAGMNEHLAKPVNPEILYNTLSKYYQRDNGDSNY